MEYYSVKVNCDYNSKSHVRQQPPHKEGNRYVVYLEIHTLDHLVKLKSLERLTNVCMKKEKEKEKVDLCIKRQV